MPAARASTNTANDEPTEEQMLWLAQDAARVALQAAEEARSETATLTVPTVIMKALLAALSFVLKFLSLPVKFISSVYTRMRGRPATRYNARHPSRYININVGPGGGVENYY